MILKIEQHESIIKGEEVLKVLPGSLLRVQSVPKNHLTVTGSMLLRLKNNNYPLCNTSDGRMLSGILFGYEFKLLAKPNDELKLIKDED